ncbi:hypothetical protein [Clostridium merdae]|uniref:hypothetical protein n=1 Tax=Clostridium merdae TaxID=1958780 RepID=UPI000A271D53|nr:hypothetical protein [Clostridium merdae]
MSVKQIGRVTGFILLAAVLFFFIQIRWLEYKTLALLVILFFAVDLLKRVWHWILQKRGSVKEQSLAQSQKRDFHFEFIGYLTIDAMNWFKKVGKVFLVKQNK